MSDIYKTLEVIKERHWKEKHEENRGEYQEDPSCLICYRVKEDTEPNWFKKFWEIFQKAMLVEMNYNKNTIVKLAEYIVLTRKDKDDRYLLNRKKRVKELEEVRREGEKLLDVIVVSIRYKNEPDYKKIWIISAIKIICEHYIFDEEDKLLIDEDKTRENLLGNKELIKYGYIIEDDELDRRFVELEEWLEDEKIVTVEFITQHTMRYFKKILHMEEKMNFQRNIKYRWCDSNKYPESWINDDLTNEIIKRIVEMKSFIREDSDVGELESSNDTESSEEGNEHFERILRNYWIENNYEIDITEVK
ncbi:hypothetical protein RhiirC2_788615 [Rhizophagus irregularis]|uniref:Uncharacterized protein n=1 Tax=Rhizophagus irregularis TaxID=588596 RepID=A0A2N1MPR2_9GLOM|nr:hypothetical protein RhiirC2_788615 [Rhizophagus irregularis]